jgi:hypothetical protein
MKRRWNVIRDVGVPPAAFLLLEILIRAELASTRILKTAGETPALHP